MRRLLSLITLLALPAAFLTATTTSSEAATYTPTVVTYNVRNCCNGDNTLLGGHRSWTYRKSRVVKVLASANADIIALQESTPYNTKTGREGTPTVFPTNDVLAGLRDKLPAKNYALATSATTATPIIYSQATMSVPAESDKNIVIASGRATRLRNISSGKSVMVANVHLPVRKGRSKATSVTSELYRRDQLRSAVRSTRALAESGAGKRAVYLGDLNTYPGIKLSGSGAAKHSYEPGKMMKRAKILDASSVCVKCGTKKYATYNGFKKRNTGPKDYDRIFVSKSSKALSVRTWSISSSVSYVASDHFPVRARLSF